MPQEEIGIAGIVTMPLAIVPTGKGDVLHFLRPGTPLYPERFGEIYFSEILPGAIKAWKRHRRQTQLFAVPCGKIKIVLYDGRVESPTRGKVQELYLGRPDDYRLLKIPPGIWYGFKAESAGNAIICNCADMPHDPEEGEKLDISSPLVPYAWL